MDRIAAQRSKATFIRAPFFLMLTPMLNNNRDPES